MEPKMLLEMDADVRRVLEFMQANLPCDKLVAVADAVSPLAAILWGSYSRAEVRPLSLRCPDIGATSLRRLGANE